jgi:hypothetical protein
VPYLTIIVPSGTVIGRTVDAKIGVAPGRVTLLSEGTLRIEPDDVCRIIAAAAGHAPSDHRPIPPRPIGPRCANATHPNPDFPQKEKSLPNSCAAVPSHHPRETTRQNGRHVPSGRTLTIRANTALPCLGYTGVLAVLGC